MGGNALKIALPECQNHVHAPCLPLCQYINLFHYLYTEIFLSYTMSTMIYLECFHLHYLFEYLSSNGQWGVATTESTFQLTLI